MKKKSIILSLIVIMTIPVFYGCSALNQIKNSLNAMKKMEFKLGDVNSFKLNGINLSNKTSIKNFSIADGIKLTSAFKDKKLPVDFILDLDARNPNKKSAQSNNTLTLVGLDWTLYIDDKETISGGLAKSVKIPGDGKSETIPLRISMDLYEFFGNKGYDGILNLALALGGKSGSSSKIKLVCKPTVDTFLGPLSYPSPITVVNTEFRSK